MGNTKSTHSKNKVAIYRVIVKTDGDIPIPIASMSLTNTMTEAAIKDKLNGFVGKLKDGMDKNVRYNVDITKEYLSKIIVDEEGCVTSGTDVAAIVIKFFKEHEFEAHFEELLLDVDAILTLDESNEINDALGNFTRALKPKIIFTNYALENMMLE